MEKVAISEVVKNPTLLNKDNYFGFYDWFCKESSLAGHYKHLLPKLKFLVKIGLIDADNSYVWFKNNSPVVGNLYNDIRISSLNKKIHFLVVFVQKVVILYIMVNVQFGILMKEVFVLKKTSLVGLNLKKKF